MSEVCFFVVAVIANAGCFQDIEADWNWLAKYLLETLGKLTRNSTRSKGQFHFKRITTTFFMGFPSRVELKSCHVLEVVNETFKTNNIVFLSSPYETKFFIILFDRAFKVMKNGVYFILIALLVTELFKISIYAN